MSKINVNALFSSFGSLFFENAGKGEMVITEKMHQTHNAQHNAWPMQFTKWDLG